MPPTAWKAILVIVEVKDQNCCPPIPHTSLHVTASLSTMLLVLCIPWALSVLEVPFLPLWVSKSATSLMVWVPSLL